MHGLDDGDLSDKSRDLQDVFYPIPRDLQSFLNSMKSIKRMPDAEHGEKGCGCFQ